MENLALQLSAYFMLYFMDSSSVLVETQICALCLLVDGSSIMLLLKP